MISKVMMSEVFTNSINDTHTNVQNEVENME